MAKPYQIALFATNTYYAADSDGLVPVGVDSPPTTLPTPSVPNGWVYVDGLYLHPERRSELSDYTTPGQQLFKTGIVRRGFTFKTLDFAFPGAFADYDALEYVVSGVKRYLYLHIVEYDVAPTEFHGASEALAVTCKHTPEHVDDKGLKTLTLDFTLRSRIV